MKGKKLRSKLAFLSEFLGDVPFTAVKNIKVAYGEEHTAAKPRALRIKNMQMRSLPSEILKSRGGEVIVKILNFANASERMVNCDGDEVWYVSSGAGRLFTVFGLLRFEEESYIYIPKACAYRFLSESADCRNPAFLVGIESESPFQRPDFGDFANRNIPYAPEAILKPIKFSGDDLPDRSGEWDVRIKRLGKYSTVATYPFSPFSNVSWRGDVFPFILKVRDINTVVSPTEHIDPAAFATFVSKNKSVAISTFKERWMHSLPYNHMNYYDEFLFYAKKYAARGNIVSAGDATFHPQGIWHGPQIEASQKEKKVSHPKYLPWAEELAIMFESKMPLMVSDCALRGDIDIAGYWKSWHDGLSQRKERK